MSGAPRHCFVVAAYGRSPHLEACLESLQRQDLPSPVTVSTSTPFEGMEALVGAFGAELLVHSPNRGIGADWNHALRSAAGNLVTIVHQDDLYAPGFAREVTDAHRQSPDAVLSFCDCQEIDDSGTQQITTWNNRVKRLLIGAASIGTQTLRGGWRRRLLLGFGNPITCPSVSIDRRVAPHFRFNEDLRTNMDWFAWIELSRRFPLRYIRRRLVYRRIHADSETSRCIVDGSRPLEDRMVLDALWPRPISTWLATAYRLSYPGYSH